jgi:hypothetical protein
MTKLANEYNVVTPAPQSLPEHTLAFCIRVVGRSVEQINATVYRFVDQAKSRLIIHSTPRITIAKLPGSITDF